MLKGLQPGAEVEHDGMQIGSVERVMNGHVLVRHGRADYLLRIPERFLRVESPQRACIDSALKLDEVERTALESGKAPPVGKNITEAGPTAPSPQPEEIAGRTAGMPLSYDGPATG